MSLRAEMKKYFIHEKADFIDDKEAVTDFDDLKDKDIDNDGDTDDSDEYLHKRFGTIAKANEISGDAEFASSAGDHYVDGTPDDSDDITGMGVAIWMAGKDYPGYGTAKKVKQISDDRVEVTFRDGNTYTFVLEPGYNTWVEESVTEMSTTAAVPGYDTPNAFGDSDEDTVEVDGWKKAPKTNKYFKPMEGKSTFKNMMAEMYGLKEATSIDIQFAVKAIRDYNSSVEVADVEIDDLAVDVLAALGFKPTSKNIDATIDHLSASADGYDVPADPDMVRELYPILNKLDEAVSYREYKKDPNSTPKQKVNKGIAEVNKMLGEMEKIVNNNLRLKQETGVDSSHFWKSTSGRFAKINERMTRISNRLKELSK